MTITLYQNKNGVSQFPVYDGNGKLTHKLISYLVAKVNGKEYSYGFEVGPGAQYAEREFRRHLEAL